MRAGTKRLRAYPFKGLLFDLDGTLVNSLPAVDRAWRQWSIEFGLDPAYVVPRIHGRRAVDSIALLVPHTDQQEAFKRLEHLESTDTDGVVPMPGAIQFIAKLTDIPWGIVTSGSSPIAIPRLKAGGIVQPSVFVTAEQISNGKPHPEAFLEGARRLALPPGEVIAFEDTLAGVRSAKSAGMKVVALSDEAFAEADVRIETYDQIDIGRSDAVFELTFK
ncbi:MAG: HAD-IA family hydrolase [Chlorobia bacterium]|nr:HAD-IA family hydrolase [Fimbriimonadaceae bacterium]